MWKLLFHSPEAACFLFTLGFASLFWPMPKARGASDTPTLLPRSKPDVCQHLLFVLQNHVGFGITCCADVSYVRNAEIVTAMRHMKNSHVCSCKLSFTSLCPPKSPGKESDVSVLINGNPFPVTPEHSIQPKPWTERLCITWQSLLHADSPSY